MPDIRFVAGDLICSTSKFYYRYKVISPDFSALRNSIPEKLVETKYCSNFICCLNNPLLHWEVIIQLSIKNLMKNFTFWKHFFYQIYFSQRFLPRTYIIILAIRLYTVFLLSSSDHLNTEQTNRNPTARLELLNFRGEIPSRTDLLFLVIPRTQFFNLWTTKSFVDHPRIYL